MQSIKIIANFIEPFYPSSKDKELTGQTLKTDLETAIKNGGVLTEKGFMYGFSTNDIFLLKEGTNMLIQQEMNIYSLRNAHVADYYLRELNLRKIRYLAKDEFFLSLVKQAKFLREEKKPDEVTGLYWNLTIPEKDMTFWTHKLGSFVQNAGNVPYNRKIIITFDKSIRGFIFDLVRTHVYKDLVEYNELNPITYQRTIETIKAVEIQKGENGTYWLNGYAYHELKRVAEHYVTIKDIHTPKDKPLKFELIFDKNLTQILQT